MRFYTDSLLSKWGFGDGDMLDDLLFDNGLPYGHDVLIRVVRNKILPVIQQNVEVYEISTNHNPIRAKAVDGIEVDDYNYNPNIKLTPEYVDVPDSEILELAREI